MKLLSRIFRRKPAPGQKPEDTFSTHRAGIMGVKGFRKSDEDRKYFDELMSLAFPRKAEDLQPVGPGGEKINFAMDDGGNNLSATKMLNTWGQNISEAELGWYVSQGFLGYQTCAIIAQHWMVDKACTMPARDAIRHGYEITVNDGTEVDPEIFEFMRECDRKYKIKNHCKEFIRKGRMFGIRVAMFKVKSVDEQYYEKPFNPDGITPGSYQGIVQIDPYWISPELDGPSAADPASPFFYEPTWWRINGKRIHRTHLVVFVNGEMPDILKPAYYYGGVPVPQKIYERVYAAERTSNEAPMLAMTKRLNVLKVDLSKVNGPQLQEQLANFNALRDNYGTRVIGIDEDAAQLDTSLTDLDAVIMTQWQIVAAAADVPATKLLGTSPKGFGASGEYEEASYAEFLESMQEHDLMPLIQRHHLCVMRSDVVPKFKCVPIKTEINFLPVDTPTAIEQADINLKNSQTDKNLNDSGAIDGQDIRNRIVADKTSGYNGISELVPEMPEVPEITGHEESANGDQPTDPFK